MSQLLDLMATLLNHIREQKPLFCLRKMDEKINPKKDDYEIFMAVSENSGKDNSGLEIYETDEKAKEN